MVDQHVVVNGQFVSERIERIVLAIKEYSPELDVDWVPPGARRENQAAFRIMHRPVDTPEYCLMTIKDEDSFDERVLHRIIAGDQRNGAAPTYSEVEAAEKARELVAKQEYLDKMEEAEDMVAHVIRTHKSRYKIHDGLIIDDSIPFNVAGTGL